MNEQCHQSLFIREINYSLKGSGGKVVFQDDQGLFFITCSSQMFKNQELKPSDFLIRRIEVMGKRYFHREPTFDITMSRFWFD